MSALRTYLAEAYAPSSSDFSGLLEQAQRASTTTTPTEGVRHVRSILLTEDEICFHLFEAASVESLRNALDAVALRALRIVEVRT